MKQLAESQFLKLPRETKIGLKNQEFEKSGIKLPCSTKWNKPKRSKFALDLSREKINQDSVVLHVFYLIHISEDSVWLLF